jgi:hypothetical protein
MRYISWKLKKMALLSTHFLLVTFDPEDISDMLLRNASGLLPNYTALQARIMYSS